MNNSQNQPREFDVVLGGENPAPVTGVVLGGIEGVKRRLESDDEEVRIAALWNALNYGETGLDLIIQALKDSSQEIKSYVELLLKERGGEKGKQALLDYNPWRYLTTLDNWQIQKYNPQVGIVFPFGKAYIITNKIQLKALTQDPLVERVEALKFDIVENNLHCRKHLQEFFKLIVEAKDFLPNLKALFIGSYKYQDSVYIYKIYPILKAFPKLELLEICGTIDNDNFLKSNIEILEVRNAVDGSFVKTKPLRHSCLKSLIIQSRNLSKENLFKICNLDLPALEYLELEPDYDVHFDDMIPIISGQSFPNLTYLGIINGQVAEEIIQYLNKSPLMKSLKILNLPAGGLTTLEKIDLSESSILNRLHTLNLSENSLRSWMIDKLSNLKCRVIADEQRYDVYDVCIE
ncbi:MAG: hypothetical protein AAF915_19170 [Cyanobacteria bacterium P01_D01_bin.50]